VFWEHAEEALSDERVPLRPERAVRAFNEALHASCKPALIYSDAGTPTPYM